MPGERFSNEAWLFLGPLAVAGALVLLLYRTIIVDVVRSALAP